MKAGPSQKVDYQVYLLQGVFFQDVVVEFVLAFAKRASRHPAFQELLAVARFTSLLPEHVTEEVSGT